MDLTKGYDEVKNANTVYCIQTLAGETIVSKVTSATPDTIVLMKPLQIIIHQAMNEQTGKPEASVSMPPYINFTKNKHVTINSNGIFYMEEASKEITDAYIQLTTSIIVPS